MNIVFAVFAIAVAYMIGLPLAMAPSRDTTIGYVNSNSPAERAGMLPGDKVISIGGYKVKVWSDIREDVGISPGKELEIVVLRDGKEVTLHATPESVVKLFDIDRSKFQDDLNNGILSEALRHEFRRKGLPLSEDATVHTEEPDGKQLIVDEDGKYKYIVRAEEDRLGIYVETQFGWLGVAAENKPIIGSVEKDSPAAKAGFRADDVIVAVNGNKVAHSIDFEKQLEDISDKTIFLTVKRGDENTIVMPLELEYNEDGRLISLGGISFGRIVRLNPISALIKAVPETIRLGGKIFQFLRRLIIGNIPRNMVAGPVGIVQITMLMLKTGLASTIQFAGTLSINLGIVNMLPLFITDGAMVVFLIIEKMRGKPMNRKRQMMIQQVGVAFIILLFILITYNDIARLITGSF